jgi:hypothetical protein
MSALTQTPGDVPVNASSIPTDHANDAAADAQRPKDVASHRGRSYARCCCAFTTAAAVTAAVAGVAFQLYGKEIMGAYSDWMSHT